MLRVYDFAATGTPSTVKRHSKKLTKRYSHMRLFEWVGYAIAVELHFYVLWFSKRSNYSRKQLNLIKIENTNFKKEKKKYDEIMYRKCGELDCIYPS
jgi:hypothetical protein